MKVKDFSISDNIQVLSWGRKSHRPDRERQAIEEEYQKQRTVTSLLHINSEIQIHNESKSHSLCTDYTMSSSEF